MTALAAPGSVPQEGAYPILENLIPLDVEAATKIYPGSMVAVNLSGNAVPISAAAGLRVLGRCEDDETVDNTNGSAGDLTVKVRRGVFLLRNSATTDALTKADIGRKCYAADDATVARTSNFGKRPIMGIFLGLKTVMGVSRCIVQVGVMEDDDPSELRVLAGADLSTKQYYLVKYDANAAVVLAGAGENAIGVLQNAPANGEVAIVKRWGLTKCVCGGVVAKGAIICSDANGKAVTAIKGKTDTSDAGAAADPLIGSNVLGDSLETGADGVASMIDFHRLGAVPTTAVAA